ncbi:MAG TPA: cupin domain-containing protein [Chthoniobacterales bacterium]|nr:cupin domain-containing protein [Chthoniobacterales bacterium]
MKPRLTVIFLVTLALGITFAQVNHPYTIGRPGTLNWQPGDIFPGTDMALIAGDPHHPGDFTMRIRTSGASHVNPYSYPDFENITVLNGNLYVGFGPTVSAAGEETLPIGGFISINPGTVHYWRTDAGTVLQFHGNGCLQPIFLNAPAPPPCV